MKLKLVYFKMRALAEAPQMLMRCHNIEYDYLMSWEHFGDVWPNVKPTLTFKQLPMLEVNGTQQICQSVAILQYLETVAGITLHDPVKAAQSGAILQSAQELFAPLNPTVNFAVGDDFNSKKEAMRPILTSRFSDLDNCLQVYEGKYFLDDTPRAAEFAAYHHLNLSKLLDETLIAEFPRLQTFLHDMEEISELANYLDKRPQLIDVGEAPKLIINGKAHPTGVTQN
jgi:glutathione S-transferase